LSGWWSSRGGPTRRYEVHFASAQFGERLFHGTSFTRWPMTTTLPADKIEAVVASGSMRRIYDKPVLETARNEGAAAGRSRIGSFVTSSAASYQAR
jgi:hypothetical protein